MSSPGSMTLFYAFIRFLLVILTRLFFFLRRSGTELIPRQGGCLIASNHASYLDPMLLAVACPRMLCFMAKEELFTGILGMLIRHLNAFPVRRGSSDVRAMRQAIAKLKQGHALIIFPEGTRSRDGSIGTGHPGISMLAQRAGVPVIPAYIEGSGRAWPNQSRWPRLFVPLRIRFGSPLLPDGGEGANDRERYQSIADSIIQAIADIKNNLS